MSVTPFAAIHARVVDRFGSAKAIERELPQPLSNAELIARDDAFYLSLMSRRVFRAGLKHALVDNKWSAFENAFYGFNPRRLEALSDEELEAYMGNDQIIRHFGKIKSIRANATMVERVARESGSFGQWLADWSGEDIVGLWAWLKKNGNQLGGLSGPYFLRMAGKDTFILTDDVVAALVNANVVSRRPTTQAEMRAVAAAFNGWRGETGRPLCQLSRLLSLTVNYA